jgi:hypothetical protein
VLSSHEYLILILNRYLETSLQIVVPTEVTNTHFVKPQRHWAEANSSTCTE